MTRWRFETESDPEEGWPYPDDDPVDPEAEATPEPPPPEEREKFWVREDVTCKTFGHVKDREGWGTCPACGGDYPW